MPLYNPIPATVQTDDIIDSNTTIAAGFSSYAVDSLEILDTIAFEIADTGAEEIG